MKNRRRILVLAIILVAAVVSVGLTVVRRTRTATPDLIDTFAVRTDTLSETVSGTGSFVPSLRQTVYAKVSGVVADVLVEEGDRVTPGQVLLRIDDTDYLQSLERSRVTYQSTRRSALQQILNLQSRFTAAERSLVQVRRSHDKNVELRSANAISQEQFQQSQEALVEAEEALRVAREQLNLYTGRPLDAEPVRTLSAAENLVVGVPEVVQAALGVEQARAALADTAPVASTAGTVALVFVETGSLVAPNAPLVRIERLDSMNAEVQIDEVDIGKLAVGNSAEVTSDSVLGETLPGTVVRIAPTIQRVGNTRVSAVEVAIDSGDTILKSGASCTVRISTTTKEDALVIPITAYQTEDDEVYVYRLEQEDGENRYRLGRRTIELGILTVNFVEVTSGLAVGDIVAVGNVSRLREDMVVGVREEGP